MYILCKKTILIYFLNINFFLLPLISLAHSEKPSKTSLYSESAGVFRVEIETNLEKILIQIKNKYADIAVILNTGLVRIGPDLSNSASREPTNNSQWLSRYLKDSSSVRDTIPHPSKDFLTQEDFDSLITYLLSLGGSDE